MFVATKSKLLHFFFFFRLHLCNSSHEFQCTAGQDYSDGDHCIPKQNRCDGYRVDIFYEICLLMPAGILPTLSNY